MKLRRYFGPALPERPSPNFSCVGGAIAALLQGNQWRITLGCLEDDLPCLPDQAFC